MMTRETWLLSLWLAGLPHMILSLPPSSNPLLNNNGSCGLLFSIPFSDERTVPYSYKASYGMEKWTPEERGRRSFGLMAAALLAVEHFNSRNTELVPDLESLRDTCTIKFTKTVVTDSGTAPPTALTNIIKALESQSPANETSTSSVPPPFCALIGPFQERTIAATAPLAESRHLPQITIDSTNTGVTDWTFFPSVVRNTVDVSSSAEVLMDYLTRLGRSYFALLNDRDMGTNYLTALSRLQRDRGLRTQPHYSFSAGSSRPEVDLRAKLKLLRNSGLRTIVLATDHTSLLPLVAKEATAAGLVGDDFLWILVKEAVTDEYIERQQLSPESDLARLLSGAGVFGVIDKPCAHEADGVFDAFADEWRKAPEVLRKGNATSSVLEELLSQSPLKPDQEEYYVPPNDYFESNDPPEHASFVYDAVMIVGLTACRTQKEEAIQEHLAAATARVRNTTEVMLQTTFQGASGTSEVAFDVSTQSRTKDSVAYAMFNVRPTATTFVENGEARIGFELTVTNDYHENSWHDIEDRQFIYPDGSTTPPKLDREPLTENFLSASVQRAGLCLMSLSLLLYLSGAIWTFFRRKHKLIKVAQPVFLYLLCAGSALMSVTIFFLSFDESFGWNDRALDIACMTAPWFFVVGYIVIYSALFMKLWRINRILQFSRRKIDVRHVMSPFACLLAASVVTLAVWTAVDPWQWERVELEDLPRETYGKCTSPKELSFFAPIGALMGCCTLMTAIMAWKTKDVSGDLAEANFIFYGIFAQIQTWLVGIPVLAMLEGSTPHAIYLGRVLIVTTFSVSSILLILGPKVWGVEFLKINPRADDSTNSNGTTVPGRALPRGSIGGSLYITGLAAQVERETYTAEMTARRLSSTRSDRSPPSSKGDAKNVGQTDVFIEEPMVESAIPAETSNGAPSGEDSA